MNSYVAIHLLAARLASGPLSSMITMGRTKDAHCKQRPEATASGSGPIARRIRRAFLRTPHSPSYTTGVLADFNPHVLRRTTVSQDQLKAARRSRRAQLLGGVHPVGQCLGKMHASHFFGSVEIGNRAGEL